MHDEPRLAIVDMLRPLWRRRRQIALSALLGALAVGLLAGMRPVLFEAEATFKGKYVTGDPLSGRIWEVLGAFPGSLGGGKDDAVALLQSQRLLHQVANKLSLQASVVPERSSPASLLGRLRRSLRTEWRNLTGHRRLPVPDLVQRLRVVSIDYPGEVPLVLRVRVDTEGNVTLSNRKKHLQVSGYLGLPITCDHFSITLDAPDEEACGHYRIKLDPLAETLESLQEGVKLSLDTDSASLIELSYSHTDRHLAATVLNELMDVYYNYQLTQNNRRAQQQLGYLEERQDEVICRLKEFMENNVAQLSSSIEEGRYLRLSDDLEVLAGAEEACRLRMREIGLELQLLDGFSDTPEAFCEASKLGVALEPKLEALYEHRQERRTLRASLEHAPTEPPREEYVGINLDAAHNLHLELISSLEQSEREVQQLSTYRQQLRNPDFDIGSLANCLNSAVSRNLIAAANDTFYLLHDTSYRSEKEHERLAELLERQRFFLSQHLDYQILLKEQEHALTLQKIRALQQVRLELLDDQVARLEQELKDRVLAVRQALVGEECLLQQQLEELRGAMHHLPDRWMAEEQMRLCIEMGVSTVKSVTDIVQAKNIANNLEMTDSEPLDWAFPPTIPRPPHLTVFALLGAALGGMGTAGYICGSSVLKGIPASVDSLTNVGAQVLGKLHHESLSVPAVRQTLRTVRALLGHRSVLLTLTGGGPSYAWSLAELLAREQLSVLLVRWSFDRPAAESEYPGLLQYLEGLVPRPRMPVVGAIARVAAGGQCAHAYELLASERWERFLRRMRGRYSVIVIEAALPTASAEALRLAAFCDAVAATVGEETLSELEPLIDLAAEKPVGFIVS